VQICRMARHTIQQKKEHAKLLYTVEGVTVQKELAERTGVSKTTINKWVNEENWEALRASVIITKENELKRMYMQITELNDAIMSREKGERFSTSKEADVLVKLTAAVRQLESDTSVADTIEVMKNFINFVRQDNYETAKNITNLADVFIKSLLR
jgi:transcriptional regulator with XRE-family HTH domain